MSEIPLGNIPSLHAGRRGPTTPAIIHEGEVLSWAELDARSTRRAFALAAAGVGQDDLVTLALPNGLALFELSFAIWKLGATPHIVSWRLPPAELVAILEVARPKLVIASEASLLAASSGQHPDSLVDGSAGPLGGRVARYWKAMSSGGSTGRPKIILDHLPGRKDPSASAYEVPIDGVILNPGPLYHNAPFLFTHLALFQGCTVVNMAKFDAEETLRLIAQHQVEWVNLVPTMMLRIWRLGPEVREKYDLSSLRMVWHMAAPTPEWLTRAWIDWLGPERIWELYGGTERIGGTTISGVEWLEHQGSVGRPKACEIRILDEERRDLPTGEVGEVFIRSLTAPGDTYHYLGAEARRGPDGFESLGDYGWLDSDGYLYIADRRSDLILSGGANIYPAEVEAVLMEHPGVAVAVAIGLPDEDLGQKVHAIVRPNAEWTGRLTQSDLDAFVADRLVRYKTPRSYEFTDHELRDDAGKVRRTQLRDERLASAR